MVFLSLTERARLTPGKPALIVADTGAVLPYRELEAQSVRLARLLRNRGLQAGDRVAILMENCPEYLVALWATARAELRAVPVNWHLTREEAGYIVDNSDAAAIITSRTLLPLARQSAETERPILRLVFGPAGQDFESVEAAAGGLSAEPPPNEREGGSMPYSSGTTGQPKGILRPLPDRPFGEPTTTDINLQAAYGFGEDSVCLTVGPLYHAAPSYWTLLTQRCGGTAVTMQKLDAEGLLDAIQRYRVTHAQFVPTHFIRLLRLPEAVRARYDHSTLKLVLHAAAPCSVEVKQRMLDWWGPVIHEYYSGSEMAGYTSITPQEWMRKQGSVGRAAWGAIHIVDDDGQDLLPGEIGTVYFENSPRFEYHKEPDKTAGFFNDRGWGTLGDIGWMDEDGYLFLADRKSNMIISGGVNIYPQEIEDVLALHPAVQDVAVVGVPNTEFGEEVRAVVELAPGHSASPELEQQLIGYCRERLAGYKTPRKVDFVEALPRTPSGKLLKRQVKARYWGDRRVMI